MKAPELHALIAEDEPLLALALQRGLATLWPDLVTHIVGDGASAVAAALQTRPAIVFMDIRMPGMDGLEAAAQLAEQWENRGAEPGAELGTDYAPAPLPLLVFVTAYDQYAVQAFEHAAVDYLQKPVQPERLHQTVERLKSRLAAPSLAGGNGAGSEAMLAQLRTLFGALPAAQSQAARLNVIQAGSGQSLHLIPVAEVLYFEAADKYVRVVTAGGEWLIRTPVRELLAGLDDALFWQIHRGTIVRAEAIERVTRDDTGKLTVHLRGRADRLAVSRLWAYRFKAM